MAADSFTLEFEERQPGRWVLRKQILNVRSHFSWKSKAEVKEWVRGCLQLRESGHDPAKLIKHLGIDGGKESLSNLGPKGPIPFTDFVREVYPKVPNRRGRTRNQLRGWKRERQRLEQCIRQASFSSKCLHEIAEADLRGWLDEYIRRSVRSKLGNTEHAMQQMIRNIFSSAVREKYLLRDPASQIRTTTIQPAERTPVSLQDVAFIAAKADLKLRARLHLGVYAGLEAFEQDGLLIEAVSARIEWLALSGSPPKRIPRQIWIHPALDRALKPLLNGDPKAPLFRKKNGKASPFPYRALKKLCLQHGIEPFTPLHLRDLFKTLLEQGPASDNTIEFLMGHKLEGLRRFYSRTHRSTLKIQEAIRSLPPLPPVTESRSKYLLGSSKSAQN